MISFLPETVPVSLVLPTLLALVLLIGWAMAGRLASLNIGNPLERFLLFILLGVTAISWVGALLAALNWFRPWILFPVLALVGLGRWLTARQYHSLAAGNEDAKQTDGLPAQILKTEKPIPWFAQVLLIAIFIGAGWLYGHPAETFNLSDDSAVYTIGGIVLARDGSLFFRPPSVYDFASLTPIKPDAEQTIQSWEPQEDFVQQFSFTDLLASAWTRHLGPFYQWSLEDGRLEIGFLPFPKVWAALAVWFFGPARAIWAAPLFGLLGLFSLFGLLRRSVGWAPALAAVALLAGILPQVWYARVMLSEIFAQTVLIGGLYLAALAHKKATQGSPFADDLAAWSALLLGSLSLLRFEWPTMIWPLLALFIPLRATNMRHLEATWRTWLRVLLVSLALGFVISVAVAPFYLATRAIYLLAMPRLYSLLLIAAVVMGLLVWALKMSGGQLWAWATVIAPWIRWAVVGGWLLCILYAGAKLWQSGLGASFPGWLLQYVGAPLVVLGALGAIWFTSRNRSQAAELTALLGLGAFFSLLYSARSLVMPVHPWAIRRAVPIVLPALAAGAGWLLADGLPTLWQRVRRGDFTAFTRRFGPALCAVTTAAVAWSAIKPMLPFLTYVERQGLYTQLASWADSLPEDAVLLFGQGPVAERLTQAMEMIFGRPSFVLQDTGALRSESPVTDHLVRSALRQGRPVYYVLIDGNSTWRPYQWRFESVDARRFAVPTLRYAMGRPPSIEDVAEGSWIADVYRVQALGKMSGPQDVLDIPAGQGGSPYLYMGFYNWEMDARGELFRWTDGDARVTVPWPHTMREDYGDLCLRLDVSGWRPAGIRDAHLIVEVEGVRFYDAMLNRAAERQSIEIPVRAISNKSLRDLEIRLYSDSWNLGILKGEAESRRLGIMFYGLRIAPLKRCE